MATVMASPSNASVAFESQKLPILDKYQETPTLFHSADLQSAITAQICASGRHRPDKKAHKLDSDRAPKKAIQPRDAYTRAHVMLGHLGLPRRLPMLGQAAMSTSS